MVDMEKVMAESQLAAALAQLASLRTLKAGYEEFGADVPESVTNRINSLVTTIKVSTRDQKERKIKLLKQRLETLKTRDERRTDAEAELKKLEESLR